MRRVRSIIAAAAIGVVAGCRPAAPPEPGAPVAASEGGQRVVEGGAARLTLSVEPLRVRVGEPITLTLEVVAEPGVAVTMPRIDDDLGPFEVVERRVPPDVAVAEGRQWRHRYVLSTFAAGEQLIPALVATVRDERGPGDPVEGELRMDVFPVTVASVLSGDVDPGAFRDIAGAVEVPVGRPWRTRLVAAALLAIVIAAALVAILLVRRRRRGVAVAPPPPPAHVWARGELERLRAEGLVERRRFHRFYFRLSDIVREYVERRFGLMAPERTTEEFLREARDDATLSPARQELLSGFLRAADLVKFARHEPDPADCGASFDAACAFVEETRAADPRAVDPVPQAEAVAP